MDKDELWIGDTVRSLSTGQKGIFQGETPGGLARVVVENEELQIPFNELDLCEEEEEISIEIEPEPTLDLREASTWPDTIDLHIETLAPAMINQSPHRILEFQKRAFHIHLNTSIAYRKSWLHVVHGIGKGRLKEEIIALVKDRPEVKGYEESGPGALRIYLW